MAEPRRVFISFDRSDQAAALDLIDRLREASIERVTHLPDADSALVIARDDHLGNATDLEGIHSVLRSSLLCGRCAGQVQVQRGAASPPATPGV